MSKIGACLTTHVKTKLHTLMPQISPFGCMRKIIKLFGVAININCDIKNVHASATLYYELEPLPLPAPAPVWLRLRVVVGADISSRQRDTES